MAAPPPLPCPLTWGCPRASWHQPRGDTGPVPPHATVPVLGCDLCTPGPCWCGRMRPLSETLPSAGAAAGSPRAPAGPVWSLPSLGDEWLVPLAGQVGLWQVPEGTEPAEPAGRGQGGGRGRGEGGGGHAGSLPLPEPPLGTSLRALIVTWHKDVSSCRQRSHSTGHSSGAPPASQQPHCGIPEGPPGLATALQHPGGPPGLATASSACTSWTRKALEPRQLPAPAARSAAPGLPPGSWGKFGSFG